MSECERSELVLVFLDDEPEPEELARAEAHLAGCAACRETLQGYRRAAQAVRALPPEQPEPAARARAFAAVSEAMRVAPPGDHAAGRAAAPPVGGRGLLLRLAPLLAAAASVVLVISMLAQGPERRDGAGGVAERPQLRSRADATPEAAPLPGKSLTAAEPAGSSSAADQAEGAPLASAEEAPEVDPSPGPRGLQGDERKEADGFVPRPPAESEREAAAPAPAPLFRGGRPEGDRDPAADADGSAAPEGAQSLGGPGGVRSDGVPSGGALPNGGGGGAPGAAAAPGRSGPQPAWVGAWRVGDTVYALNTLGALGRTTLPPADQAPAEAQAPGAAKGAPAPGDRRVRGGAGAPDEQDQLDDLIPLAPPARALELTALSDLPPPEGVDVLHDAQASDDVEHILASELEVSPQDEAWAARTRALLALLGEPTPPAERAELLRLRARRRLERSQLQKLDRLQLERAAPLEGR